MSSTHCSVLAVEAEALALLGSSNFAQLGVDVDDRQRSACFFVLATFMALALCSWSIESVGHLERAFVALRSC